MKIFKYVIPLEGITHNIPAGATFLSCQLQNKDIVGWYLVDPNSPSSVFQFTVLGTGHEVPEYLDERHYLSTLQITPVFVVHIFAQRTN